MDIGPWDIALSVIAAVAAVLAVVGALAAIRTGWRPPWMPARIQRPRLWGQGVLLLAGCLAVQAVATVVGYGRWLPLAGLVLLLAGLGLMTAAERPPRT
ncbi:hypothetical protein ACIBL6_47865 [Streptomyces sp. NPDC050400]|uniref:hypothetical protein n=1 Tax=Streptomyces sp. NPDC050400 TaxID=3365610 RepID=UPI0037B4C137